MYGKTLILSAGLLLGLFSMPASSPARDIAPTEPPPRQILGPVIDPTRAAVVPKFVTQRYVPAGLAERAWAIKFTGPAYVSCGFGFGFGGFGYCGYSIGFGGTWAPGVCSEGASVP